MKQIPYRRLFETMIVKKEDLAKAIRVVYNNRLAPKESEDYALFLLSFFGYGDYMLDNFLLNEDRDIFNMFADEDIVLPVYDEMEIYDGRNWRILMWQLNKQLIFNISYDIIDEFDLALENSDDNDRLLRVLNSMISGQRYFGELEYFLTNESYTSEDLRKDLDTLKKAGIIIEVNDGIDFIYKITDKYFRLVRQNVQDFLMSKDVNQMLKELQHMGFHITEERLKEILEIDYENYQDFMYKRFLKKEFEKYKTMYNRLKLKVADEIEHDEEIKEIVEKGDKIINDEGNLENRLQRLRDLVISFNMRLDKIKNAEMHYEEIQKLETKETKYLTISTFDLSSYLLLIGMDEKTDKKTLIDLVEKVYEKAGYAFPRGSAHSFYRNIVASKKLKARAEEGNAEIILSLFFDVRILKDIAAYTISVAKDKNSLKKELNSVVKKTYEILDKTNYEEAASMLEMILEAGNLEDFAKGGSAKAIRKLMSRKIEFDDVIEDIADFLRTFNVSKENEVRHILNKLLGGDGFDIEYVVENYLNGRIPSGNWLNVSKILLEKNIGIVELFNELEEPEKVI
ncbi:MAG: hypothetical protein J7K22_02805 [Nanoarchaeota archaeon]|nr:hypothetical protein [Nanoarchaeota archaeon]